MDGHQQQQAGSWAQPSPAYATYSAPQTAQQAPAATGQQQAWMQPAQLSPAPAAAYNQAQAPYYSQPQAQPNYAASGAPATSQQYQTSAYPSSYAQPYQQQPSYSQTPSAPQPQTYSQPSTATPQQPQTQQGVYGQTYGSSYAQQPQPQQQQQQQQQAPQQQQQQQQAAAPYYSHQAPAQRPAGGKTWVGTVTSLIPPNYGIVDGDAFYVNAVVVGPLPQAGQRVRCEAIPNTDGGQYTWRCTSVELDGGGAAGGGSGQAAAATAGAGPGGGGGSSAPGPSSRPGGGGPRPGTGPRANGRAMERSASAGAGGEKVKYNSAPPPVVSYTADVAMAVAANAVEGQGGSAATAIAAKPAALKSAPFAKPAPELTEEEKRRSESAVQQLASFGDPSGVGAKLLAKMGFGAAEGSKGGLGRNEQGIAAPVDPVGVRGNVGLGFAAHQTQQQLAALAAQALPPPQPDRGSRRGWGRARGPEPDRGRERDRGRGGDRDRDRDRRRRSRSDSRSRSRSSSRSSRSSSSSDESSRSRSRSPSPKAAGGGSGSGRYSVRLPKFHTWERMRGLASVSKRYKRLYIPSDFCRLDANWLDTLPEHAPFPLTNPIEFSFAAAGSAPVAGAGATAANGTKAAPDGEAANGPTAGAAAATAATDTGADGTREAAAPSAAQPPAAPLSPAEVASGRRWSVRVFLLSGVPEQVLYADDPKAYRHPLRKLRVVVQKRHHHHSSSSGSKGSSSELGGIGGAWDPRDGGHPARDPRALVATAVRTFRQATGVDLSPCSQWVRFAEVVYMRQPSSSSSSGSGGPLVEERVVMMMPVDAVAAAAASQEAVETIARAQDAVFGEERARAEAEAAEEAAKRAAEAAAEATKRAVAAGGEDAALDPATLTVVQLQEELSKRGLVDASVKKWNPLQGKKPLVDKLQEFLDRKRAEVESSDTAEGAEARAAVEAKGMAEAAAARAKEAREALAAAQRAAKEARKVLSSPPVVDMMTFTPPPRSSGSSARASLTSYTLDQLLDYREEDTREATFEVSIFAEMFREMLQQRYGRALLRGLSSLLSPQQKAAAGAPAAAAAVADPSAAAAAGGGPSASDPVGPTSPIASPAGDGKTAEAPAASAPATGTKRRLSDTLGTADPAGDEGPDGDGGPGGATGEDSPAAGPGPEEAAKRQRREVAGSDGDVAGAEGAPGTPAPEEVEAAAGAGTGTVEGGGGGAVPPPTPEPFLAVCRMFDEQCAGYLESDDLEEILYMTADDVSRRRVQAVVDRAVGKRGRFSYPEYAGLEVPPAAPPKQQQQQPAASAGGGGAVNGGAFVDVAKVQANLAASEAERRSQALNTQRLEVQLSEQRRRESSLSDRVAALAAEVATLQARLNLTNAGRAAVDTVFSAVFGEVQAAQARLAAAAAQLQECGFGGPAAPPPAAACSPVVKVEAAAAAATTAAATAAAAPAAEGGEAGAAAGSGEAAKMET